MFDGNGQHQCATATVLCHLTGRVGVALHERHQSCRGKCRVLHRRALRTNVREVVSHATTAFHQLHLLLIYLEDSTIGIGLTIYADYEAVGQGGNLVVVADTRHRTALWHDVAEMIQKVEKLLSTQGIGVLLLYASHLIGNAPMHVFGRLLVDVPE